MKKLLNKKNLAIFFMLYTLLTIAVSIYNLLRGNVYDYLGFWHEIYRVFFLLICLLIFNIIKNFNFKKGLKSILDNIFPLLLALLAFIGLLYFKGDLDLDTIKKLLMYFILAVVAIALLKAMYSTLNTWIKNVFLSKKKKYFSLSSLLLIFLLLLPCFIYFLVHGFNILTNLFKTNNFYLAGLIFFMLLIVALLISTKYKDSISLDVIILLLVYYISWFVIGFNNFNVFTICIMQVLGFLVLLMYEIHNNFEHCIPFSILIIILISIGSYFYFK